MDIEERGEEIAEEVSEVVETVLAAPIAAAVEAQAEAEATAEQIAAGAMESARGQRIEVLERALEECQATLRELPSLMGEQVGEQIAALRSELASLGQRLSEAEAGRAAPAIVALPIDPTPQPELTPPPSMEEVAEVIPEALPSPPAESLPAVPRRKHRFL